MLLDDGQGLHEALAALLVVTENGAEEYETTFKLNSQSAETVKTKTFTVSEDTELSVTNTMGAIVPSGVIMKVLPVVITGVVTLAVVVFLVIRGKKRREDEDEEESDEE